MNYRLVAFVATIGFVSSLPLRESVAGMEGPCQAALTFTYPAIGTGPREFNVCLSNEGNIMQFEAPGGFVHIGAADGYILCTPEGTYWDLGPASASGFGPPTVSQPKGPHTLPVTITRTTTDGTWELKQVFIKDNNEQDVSISTYLKRLASPVADPVYIARYVDAHVDGTQGGDFGDHSKDSVWFRETRALTLTGQYLGPVVFTAVGPAPLVFSGGPTPNCRPASAAGPVGPGDLAGVVTHELSNFKTNQSRSVRFAYQRK